MGPHCQKRSNPAGWWVSGMPEIIPALVGRWDQTTVRRTEHWLLWRRDDFIMWLLPDHTVRSRPEQRLFLENPLRDGLDTPPLCPTACLLVQFLEQAVAYPRQVCKAFSHYLGPVTHQYPYPSCLVLCNPWCLWDSVWDIQVVLSPPETSLVCKSP